MDESHTHWEGVDASYKTLIAEFPSSLHDVAAMLPHQLGLVARAGDLWEGFIHLSPNRDLPGFAAEAVAAASGRPLSPEMLARFRRAHCCAGFFGLLCDRLADGQVADTPDLRALRQLFLRKWRQTLIAATGAPRSCEKALRAAVTAWHRGVTLEQAACTERELSPNSYGRILLLKLRWIGTTAEVLLHACGAGRRASAFRRAHNLLLLSLQCVDDYHDVKEDQETRGISIPDALGLPAVGVARAAPRLARQGSSEARAAGFTRLADWLDERAAALDLALLPESSPQAELAGMVLATVLVECAYPVRPHAPESATVRLPSR